MKKYLMITGSFPPDICGVGDYTAQFMNVANPNTWHLYKSSEWGIRKIFGIISAINKFKANRLVMQYPTQGYGWSLVPQIICLYYSFFSSKKFIVVLHEFSQRSFKAKLASIPLLLANHVILTTELERIYVRKIMYRKYSVIHILSNIVSSKSKQTWGNRKFDMAYFGHIRPNKGLEDFFKVARDLCKLDKNINICIIGQLLPEFKSYFDTLLSVYKLNIEIILNKPNDVVSDLLGNSKLTFLPFPDGISERRGSFLAAILNGSLVVSYNGRFVTKDLKKVYVATNLQNAVKDISVLLKETTNEQILEYQNKCNYYLQNILPSSWDKVVSLYENEID